MASAPAFSRAVQRCFDTMVAGPSNQLDMVHARGLVEMQYVSLSSHNHHLHTTKSPLPPQPICTTYSRETTGILQERERAAAAERSARKKYEQGAARQLKEAEAKMAAELAAALF